MTTPKVEILEEIEGHPVLIRVSPYRDTRDHIRPERCGDHDQGSESYVRFAGALAYIDGVWVHSDLTPSVFQRVAPRVVPQVQYVTWKPEVKGPREFRVAIDFDNVVHAYTSPWSHAADIADPPLPGAIEWLERLAADGARIILHTCRFTQFNPEAAGFIAGDPHEVEVQVWEWLEQHGLSAAACERVTMWTWVGKPYADVYVDDKAIAFTGEYYNVRKLKGLVDYHKRQRIDDLGA